MFKKLRAALSTTEAKLKAVMLVFGGLIVLVVMMATALVMTSTPKFCSSCHEMSPEYYTWLNSDHNKISCVSCHIKPGVENFVLHKIDSLSQLYYHFTGTYVKPIAIKEPIDNSICEQCHKMSTRVTTPPGDIKFSHDPHLAQGLSCVTCHYNIVHGGVEEKGFTAMTNYDSWNSAVGKAYVNSRSSADFTRVQMTTCISCHTDRKVPVTCETCHSQKVKPASHSTPAWLTSHGPEAAKDFTACDKCHGATSEFGGNFPAGTTVADYARSNTFCNSCHVNKPAGHSTTWRRDHTVPAKANVNLCYVCHDDSKAPTAYKAPTALTCQACHAQQHMIPAFHPIQIPASGYGATCTKCHAKGTCESCHIRTG